MRFKPPDPVGTRRNNQASKFFSLLFNHTLIYPSHIQIRSAWTVPASDVQLIDHVGQCQGPAQTVQSLDNDNPSRIGGGKYQDLVVGGVRHQMTGCPTWIENITSHSVAINQHSHWAVMDIRDL